MQQENLGHFSCCHMMKTQISAMFPCAQFAQRLSILSTEFNQQFANFDVRKSKFELLSNLFTVEVENLPTNLQMELIEFQTSDMLKSKYDAVGIALFPNFIPNIIPQLCTKLLRYSLVWQHFVCEQLLFLIKLTKTDIQQMSTFTTS